MAKIRVNDLAHSMGLENQDLVFKLKSIGVRVEGEEALIDTDIIQAILEGKQRLPPPREVILRDDSLPEPAPAPAKRTPLRRPGGHRRQMIQRVEPRIRELEVRGPGFEEAPAEGVPPEAVVAFEEPAAPEVKAAATAATKIPEAEPPTPAEKPPVQAVPPEKAAESDSAPAKEEMAAKAKPSPAPAAAKPAAPEPAVAQPSAPKPAAAKPAAAKPASKPAVAKPAAVKPAAAKPASKPAVAKPSARPGGAAKPARAPASDAKRPAAARPRQPPRRRGARMIQRPEEQRPPIRPVRASAVDEAPRLPASDRGRRRAQRRQEETPRTSSGLKFRDSGPEGPVTLVEGMTVREFAEKLGVKAKDLMKALLMQGIMANINHVLDFETARKLAEELGVEVMEVSVEEEVQLQHESKVEGEEAPKVGRAPVVTVMGHVDHGKTTLLDRIRSTKVAEGEAGGITQHIGAYHVDVNDNQIVFLDTPGHEAFTMMRARGTKVTDIVILVVAADDSVMPQTIEAIDHAKAAKVPIVVAINKIDKANANLDRVRKELADHNLLVEDWGGNTVSVPISALNGDGVDDLLEMILITADLLELKANESMPAHGAVLEARKDTGRGIVSTVLVEDGCVEVGDVFMAGSTWGRVRTMTDDRGQRLKKCGPATPVEVTGFTEVPGAGDLFQVMEDESKARSIAEMRRQEERQRELRPQPGRMSLEQLFSQMGEDEVKELPIIIKADVDGSVEVLRETLRKLSTEKVKINILHAAVGGITTRDVIFASASNAIIVGFNIRPERNAAVLAEKEQVEIRLHTVIYELQDELKQAMAGLLEPTFLEVRTGLAEVRDTFRIPRIGVIAGAHIVDGFIPRNATVRLLRDSRVVWEGKITSLKRFKEDVTEVRNGFDCGIGLERYQDIKPGDSIEAFSIEEVPPVL